MHPHVTARPRRPRVWTTPLAHALPAGIASLVGILLFSQMIANPPAKAPALAAATAPAISWRVPVESGALATVTRDEHGVPPKPALQTRKTAAEAPVPRARTAAKPVHPAPVQNARQETSKETPVVGPPLELAAWQRPDPAPVRPRADLTGARTESRSAPLVEPARRAIAIARAIPETVQTWIGDVADWVGGGLSPVLPSRDGMRASF